MRAPEDHLTSADVVGRSSGSMDVHPSSRASKIDDHAAQCADCAALLQFHKALTMLPGPIDGNGGDCISEDEIYRLAAGVAATDGVGAMRHIATCPRCGPLLKQAVYDLGMEDPYMEAGPPVDMQQFRSSKPSWHQNLAILMVQERKIAEIPRKATGLLLLGRRPKQLRIFGLIAAVLMVTIGITYFYWINQRSHNVARLLAMSYNAKRLTDLRIPGGEPVALFSPTLGAPSQSMATSQLLEAKLEAQKHLDQKPDDPHWRQVLGEIALVEHHGDEARQNFELAQALDSTLPGLEFDLAGAYFQMGETNRDPTLLARATNFYGQSIDLYKRSNRKDMLALAYYNLALSEERQEIHSAARKYYRLALSVETDPAWRKEIQMRIDHLPPEDGKSDATDSSNAIPSPANFLRAELDNREKSADDYEIYLDAATRSWIAERPRSSTLHLALEDLAQIGLKHQDSWVGDLLSKPASEADQHLSKAVSADLRGDAGLGIVEARQASKMYLEVKNVAGFLRAQAEEIYALQRLGRSHDCVKLASPLEKNLELGRYAWLQGYLLLELASCEGAAGDLLPSTRPLRTSLAEANSAHLRLEHLRALGFLADQLSMLGQPREAWQIASAGLSACVRTRGTAMRTYQFLSTIQNAAAAEGMLWTAAITAEAAAQSSLELDNTQIKAYAQEQLGAAEAAVHHLSEAQAAFASAKQQLDSLGDNTAGSLYDADWTADRADLLEQKGDILQALAQMRSVAQKIESNDNHALRQHYFVEYGHLLLSAQRDDEARQQALQATADAELASRTLQSGVEKLTWERDNARGYRILVESLIDKKNPSLSLRAWEWFRSASYRSPWLTNGPARTPIELPLMPDLPAVPENELVLVYARLDHGYAAWSIVGTRAPQVRFTWIPLASDQLTRLVETHSNLVRDVSSPIPLISAVGADLFKALMVPFADQIGRAATLRIDIDPSLQSVPLAALSDFKHGWLGAAHAIVLLPPWWSRHALTEQRPEQLENALVVAGNLQIGTDNTTRVPQQYEESAQVARKFQTAQVLRYPEVRASALFALLPSAQVFHFNGHAIEREGVTGLLLTTQDNLLTSASFPIASFHVCQVAVLAGCTTIGRSAYRVEDPRSLVNAILLAGARNVIATQWDVDSRASQELMLHFYDSLLAGSTPADALRLAQNTLLSSPLTSHPSFWAAYQTYGR